MAFLEKFVITFVLGLIATFNLNNLKYNFHIFGNSCTCKIYFDWKLIFIVGRFLWSDYLGKLKKFVTCWQSWADYVKKVVEYNY